MTSLIITEEPNGATLWLRDDRGLHFLEHHRDGYRSAKRSMDSITEAVRRQREEEKSCTTQPS